MKLVIFPPVEEPRYREIVAAAGPMEVVNAADEIQAVAAVADADAFFGKLTPSLLAAAPQLRWVQSPTASLEHYLFPELVEHPAILTNMRGLYSDVVADHAWALILALARNLQIYIRQQLDGRYEPVGGGTSLPDFARGPGVQSPADRAHTHLSDCTLGVIGLGQIGREIARRGRIFGMRVVGVDPQQDLQIEGVDELWLPGELDRLLAVADFVVIAAPHTPETEQMFRHRQFQMMKPTSRLVNVGRGAIVNLADLVSALEAREIAGAALDVFEIEPLPPDHPLWRMENVILTPHVAAMSPRIAERHLALLTENVRRFVGGQPLLNVVDKRRWY